MVKVLEGWAARQEHQAAAQAEQLEALRVQAGLQMQALVQLAGGGDSATRQMLRIHLPKTTLEDDTQGFLEAFEVAAEACHWPREEWVVRLLPLLSGEAQQAAHSLPPSARGVYQNVRKAALDRTGYSPEEQRRRFRDLGMADEDRPFAYAQHTDGPRQTVAAARDSVRGGRRGTGRTGEVCGRAACSHSDLSTLPSSLQPQRSGHPPRGPYGPLPCTTPRREAGAGPTVEVSSSCRSGCYSSGPLI